MLCRLWKEILKYYLYCCPQCKSNVVFYNNKVDVISDRMVKYLKDSGRIQYCGDATFPKKRIKTTVVKQPLRGKITRDQLVDFKILLETSANFDDFLSKL